MSALLGAVAGLALLLAWSYGRHHERLYRNQCLFVAAVCLGAGLALDLL